MCELAFSNRSNSCRCSWGRRSRPWRRPPRRGVASALASLGMKEVINAGIIGRVDRSGEHSGENTRGNDREGGCFPPGIAGAWNGHERKWAAFLLNHGHERSRTKKYVQRPQRPLDEDR